MEDLIIRSTKLQIEDFKESMIWLDILDELNQLAEQSKSEYDIVGEPFKNDSGYRVAPTTAETLIHLGDIKGRRKAIDYFRDIPDILLSNIEKGKSV